MGTALARVDAAPVVDYAREMDGARMLMKSGLLPQGIKSPEAAMFIILTGRDLGLSPVQSLRSIHVIQGKIEVAADMQLGLYHRAGGRSQWLELTNEKAVLLLAAPWLIQPHTETFTLTDAKQAKLGGDNWSKYPKAMLRSRAITAGLKSIGFDPTAGMYAPGEIGGAETVEVVDGAPVVAEVIDLAKRPVSLKALPDDPYLSTANAPQAADSPTPTDAPATVATTSTSGDDGEDPAEVAEARALLEIETLLPSLNIDQQVYTREALRDGGNAEKLLVAVRRQAAKLAEKKARAS